MRGGLDSFNLWSIDMDMYCVSVPTQGVRLDTKIQHKNMILHVYS